MTQTRASRKRNHQELEEEPGMFLPLSKRRDFNFNGPGSLQNGHGSPGHDEIDGMERLHIQAASSNTTTPSPTSPIISGAMISPSMHGGGAANQHHQHQLHPVPRSPSSPHQHQQHPQMLATHLVANQDGTGGVHPGSEVHGLPNVPVSPAHSPNVQGLSNSLSASSSQYNEINRILREAHFSRVGRINGVELRPDELHL